MQHRLVMRALDVDPFKLKYVAVGGPVPVVVAHVAGIPVEETILSSAPVLALGGWAFLRAWLTRQQERVVSRRRTEVGKRASPSPNEVGHKTEVHPPVKGNR